jgi:hypothetical protein
MHWLRAGADCSAPPAHNHGQRHGACHERRRVSRAHTLHAPKLTLCCAAGWLSVRRRTRSCSEQTRTLDQCLRSYLQQSRLSWALWPRRHTSTHSLSRVKCDSAQRACFGYCLCVMLLACARKTPQPPLRSCWMHMMRIGTTSLSALSRYPWSGSQLLLRASTPTLPPHWIWPSRTSPRSSTTL